MELNTACAGCGGIFRRPEVVQRTDPDGGTIYLCTVCHADSMAQDIATRTGQSTAVCYLCHTTVPVHESVRSFVPVDRAGRVMPGPKKKTDSTRAVRLCRYCAKQDPMPPWCRQNDHRIVITPMMPHWDAETWTWPLPQHSRPGVCADCAEPLIYDAGQWIKLTWPVVAREWEKEKSADAR